MSVPMQRKVRRILMALHIAGRPLTTSELIRVTCHWPGTVAFALFRLEQAGWVERQTSSTGQGVVVLTDRGRKAAGLEPIGGQR